MDNLNVKKFSEEYWMLMERGQLPPRLEVRIVGAGWTVHKEWVPNDGWIHERDTRRGRRREKYRAKKEKWRV